MFHKLLIVVLLFGWTVSCTKRKSVVKTPLPPREQVGTFGEVTFGGDAVKEKK